MVTEPAVTMPLNWVMPEALTLRLAASMLELKVLELLWVMLSAPILALEAPMAPLKLTAPVPASMVKA